MSIESDLLTAIKAHAGTVALVGTRVYAVRFPQNPTFPLVTFNLIGRPREQAVNDTVISRSSLFQVDAWDDDYHGVVTLATQLESCLSGMTGTTVTFGSREIMNELDLFDPETGLYHRPMDVRLLTWT